MPRIDLNVPFSEKDDAKRLGARWDANKKVWFISDGADLSAFRRWLPQGPDVGIRAESYFIAKSGKHCWKCGDVTRVFGVGVPAGYETLELDDEEDGASYWRVSDQPSFVHYVTDLLPGVAARVKALSHYYRIDFSKTTQSSYWMNHCEHCGMKQGDFEMYCEPSGAFFPMNRREASLIVLDVIAEPFGCNGDTSYGDHFFDFMQWI